NAFDETPSTRWAGYGLGTWIRADLGQQQMVCSVDIAWYKGDTRTYKFVIAASTDASSWTNVYSGRSSGNTASEERYSFPETKANYIRITVNGNTDNNWASIKEIDVNGYAPVASTDSTAPSVTITSPSSGSTVSVGTRTIAGNAADNSGGSGVGKVEVRLDGGSYIMATPKAAGDWSGWSASLNIASSGAHSIYARATDKAGNAKVSSISITAGTTTTLDEFGIKKIYPTKSGGNEWYVNMNDPRSDPLFRNLPTMTKQSDGSWRVSASQVRMEAWSPSNQKWQNVEITEYAKIQSGSSHLLQMYSRGGHHTSTDECLGSALKARLYGNGNAMWVKEVNHPAYTGTRGGVQATTNTLEDRWIGFKAVIYNFVENGRTYVRMESYIDDDVTGSNGNLVIRNNWKLASVVEDRGGWATTNSDFNPRCAPMNKDSSEQYRQRDEILNMPGGTSSQNIVGWRSDGLTWDFKYLSAREISAPTS
ncbi:MAG TPA: discoidin domain-containing protein, partial [Nitrososphaera sp.]|nr:discoidin domain-containing protein [Nitrososphaera sp.]